jgi:Ca-activated chloride channel family protein
MLDQPEGLRDAFRFRVTAPNAEQYGTPYSPTHGISSRRDGDDLVITLDSAATGDVELFIPLRRGLVGTSVLAHAPGGEDGFFMLLVAPPHDVESSAVPRDLTLVMDVSGSMSGDKIEQARAALRQALGTLRPADRFRVIAFSNRVTHFRETYVGATRDNLDAARAFVDRLVADGGTNIAAALEAALSGQSADGRLPIVVFATDGLPSVGEQAPERIAQNAGAEIGRARIFTVGVGTDVNTYLLDRLAQEGRGTAEYVAPEASVETAMGSLLAKIQHPALVNLRIENAPLELTLTYPSRLPDLFYGQELVVFGRYRGETRGEIVVVGERNGRAERFTAQAVFPASETDNEFIPRLWAARRIGELTRQIRIEGATPTLMEEVRQLGLRYGILTEYTSYLVQEPTAITTVLPRPPRPNEAPAPALRGGAGAARLQTGREAFERSRASSAMSGVGSLAAADAAAGQRYLELAGEARRNMRRVGGRIFVELNGVWTDASHQDSLRVVEVAPFSPAYFQLVGQLPELGSWLRAGEQVLIAGRRVSIKVSPGGLTTWRQGQLDSVVRAFRGAQRAGGA